MKTTVSWIAASAVWLTVASSAAWADSGGPYTYVPDLRKDEYPPTFAIHKGLKTLSFYVSHLPVPVTKPGESEPSQLDWRPLPEDILPSLHHLGQFPAEVTTGKNCGRRVGCQRAAVTVSSIRP